MPWGLTDDLIDAAFGATSGCDNQLQRQEILACSH
jgi:hypothetical protein